MEDVFDGDLEEPRKLAFAEQIPEPATQMLLPIQTDIEDNEIDEE